MRIRKFNESDSIFGDKSDTVELEKAVQDFKDIYHQLSDINYTMDSYVDEQEFYYFDDNYNFQPMEIKTGYIGNKYMVDIPGVLKSPGMSYDNFTIYYETLTQIKFVLDVYKDDYIIFDMKLEKGNASYDDYFGFYITSKTAKI